MPEEVALASMVVNVHDVGGIVPGVGDQYDADASIGTTTAPTIGTGFGLVPQHVCTLQYAIGPYNDIRVLQEKWGAGPGWPTEQNWGSAPGWFAAHAGEPNQALSEDQMNVLGFNGRAIKRQVLDERRYEWRWRTRRRRFREYNADIPADNMVHPSSVYDYTEQYDSDESPFLLLKESLKRNAQGDEAHVIMSKASGGMNTKKVATILDSGATWCVFKDRSRFSDYKVETLLTLKIADNTIVRVAGTGTVKLACGIILY